jgi:hypothetical protein
VLGALGFLVQHFAPVAFGNHGEGFVLGVERFAFEFRPFQAGLVEVFSQR